MDTLSVHARLVRAAFDRDAEALCARYEGVDPAVLLAPVADLLPEPPASVLDVGCGSGRDAAALARAGHQVNAVDASPAMLREARRRHGDVPVRWLGSALPLLEGVDGRFDLVTCNAVLMFLADGERGPALGRLCSLVAPGGVLLVALRHGAPDASRGMADVDDAEVLAAGRDHGMSLLRHVRAEDALGRAGTSWSLMVHRRP
jgi:Methylase involved in ubiquinone/menaquinone biosynthesis